jgi:hypothetical protein
MLGLALAGMDASSGNAPGFSLQIGTKATTTAPAAAAPSAKDIADAKAKSLVWGNTNELFSETFAPRHLARFAWCAARYAQERRVSFAEVQLDDFLPGEDQTSAQLRMRAFEICHPL